MLLDPFSIQEPESNSWGCPIRNEFNDSAAGGGRYFLILTDKTSSNQQGYHDKTSRRMVMWYIQPVDDEKLEEPLGELYRKDIEEDGYISKPSRARRNLHYLAFLGDPIFWRRVFNFLSYPRDLHPARLDG
jgi:hypothetical protein